MLKISSHFGQKRGGCFPFSNKSELPNLDCLFTRGFYRPTLINSLFLTGFLLKVYGFLSNIVDASAKKCDNLIILSGVCH